MTIDEGLRRDLSKIDRLLGDSGVPWAVAAGAAVYLYTGNRPPTDLDLLIQPAWIDNVSTLIGTAPRQEKAPWGESYKLLVDSIELVASLHVELEGFSCDYQMDEEMAARVRLLPVEDLRVPVLAPEDLVALKAVLQRGPEQGKHDLEDIEALASVLSIDRDYLAYRLERMNAVERARGVLEQWGWA